MKEPFYVTVEREMCWLLPDGEEVVVSYSYFPFPDTPASPTYANGGLPEPHEEIKILAILEDTFGPPVAVSAEVKAAILQQISREPPQPDFRDDDDRWGE